MQTVVYAVIRPPNPFRGERSSIHRFEGPETANMREGKILPPELHRFYGPPKWKVVRILHCTPVIEGLRSIMGEDKALQVAREIFNAGCVNKRRKSP